ncbi:MAG: hypothetical protein IKU86_11740 [Thermoguttaceae bacterium]|nr:hypothetical protein [Thermoguttaceae bacterium]
MRTCVIYRNADFFTSWRLLCELTPHPVDFWREIENKRDSIETEVIDVETQTKATQFEKRLC